MRIKSIICLTFLCVGAVANAATYKGSKTYNSYKGLVMAGYQGWFNTPYDGAGRGWYHYVGRKGFAPGSASVDMWPDVTEYEKLYRSPFVYSDGTPAYLPSSYDSTTVDTHFRWMKQYGIDGVFMQRFVSEIRNPSGRHHFDRVLSNAMTGANRYGRAIAVMYDLSGMHANEDSLVIADIRRLAEEHSLMSQKDNPSYLRHNGRPLVSVWGVGFDDSRAYGLTEAGRIVDKLKEMGFSVMIGVPTHWRTLDGDTEPDPGLHTLIRKCDVVMPWFVGRYNEDTFEDYKSLIRDDISWSSKNKVDYAPLCFPGFSWKNMLYPEPSLFIPRNGGSFFWKQLSYAVEAGAEMIYIAMFDEIDEGTAIFKCAQRVPAPYPGSTFLPLEEGVSSDHYMHLAGKAGRILRERNVNKREKGRK